jgi:hypothetical protein
MFYALSWKEIILTGLLAAMFFESAYCLALIACYVESKTGVQLFNSQERRRRSEESSAFKPSDFIREILTAV